MIHPSALISPKAKIGKNVSIGAFCVIKGNVEIGDNSVVEEYCLLGATNQLTGEEPLVIGMNSLIRAHSILYAGSSFGERLITGNRVTIREKTIAGKNFQVGTLSDIQGYCEIGDYVRVHGNVQIGQKSKIGNYIWIFSYTILTNDPHPPSNVLIGARVDDFSIISTHCVILPGVRISSHCLIGASSVVNRDTEEGCIYLGNPAKNIGPTAKIKLRDGSGESAYPWTRHFHRGYPEEIVKKWCK